MSTMKNTPVRWGVVSSALHWLSALLVLGLLVAGFSYAELITDTATKFNVMQLHKSFGILLLTVTLIRIVCRFSLGPIPKVSPSSTAFEHRIAVVLHNVFYVLLIAMPVVGWLIVSTSTKGIPTEIFGLFTLPKLIAPNKELHGLFEEMHEILAFVLIGLLLLHIGAALKHHLVYKNDILRRMLPW